jgi:hypothetical protein
LSTDSSAISIALLFYAIKAREARPDAPPARRGLKTNYTDSELTDLIRPEIAASPFHSEGHRKIWVRLRYKGIRTTLLHQLEEDVGLFGFQVEVAQFIDLKQVQAGETFQELARGTVGRETESVPPQAKRVCEAQPHPTSEFGK